MVDLSNLDAANAVIQKDSKAAASTKRFAQASTDAIHALDAAVAAQHPSQPPPASTRFLTGTHWPDPSEYKTLKANGHDFAITNVSPTDQPGAKQRLDNADAAGIKLIIGLYAFGGPEPYVLNNDGSWTISAAATSLITYLKSREASIVAMFGFNEPYWTAPDGHTDPCGVFSAANLRQLRTQIKQIWPNAKIYHDIGWPSEWAPGGDLYKAYSCIGNKYADATNVADYVGVYDYPFRSTGYEKDKGMARLQKECDYVIQKMQPAKPCWLGQTFAKTSEGSAMPTAPQLLDWHCAFRAALPAGSIVSWYVWRQAGIYDDYLVNHPELWPNTNPGVACP